MKPISETWGRKNPMGIGRNTLPDKSKFVEARINQGMITMIDPADIPGSALQVARNAYSRFDRTSRRFGTKLFTPTKPNSNAVLAVYFFRRNSGTAYTLRLTPSTIHYVNGAVWTAVTAGVGGSLTGGVKDRYNIVTAFDRCFFTNNGKDIIQEFDPALTKYKALGNAPRVRYLTAFYNRLVGFNVVGGVGDDPTAIVWSADAGITGVGLDQWDNAIDQSAGREPLIDSPSDLADFGTGIFGFTNYMIALREQSIWVATKNPIPTNPFDFKNVFPGLGCNCPDSAVITLNGITWTDRLSGSVWTYAPGGQPEPIGRPIERDIMRGLDDPANVFGSYDPITQEYEVCIPQAASNFVRAWTYNFRTKAWTYKEYEAVCSIDNPSIAAGIITIDDLGDVPIDQLIGTIDSLSPSSDVVPIKAYGRTDGEIIVENENVYRDPVVSGSLNTTGKFTTELISKAFSLPTDDGYFCEVRIGYIPIAAAPMSLYYSKDGGVTWNTTPKTITPLSGQIGKAQLFRLVKNVKTRRFAWKLVMEDGQAEIIEYEVHVYEGGESRA